MRGCRIGMYVCRGAGCPSAHTSNFPNLVLLARGAYSSHSTHRFYISRDGFYIIVLFPGRTFLVLDLCPPSVLHGDPSSVFQQRLASSHFNSVEHIWIQFNQFKFTRSPWNSLKLTPNPFKANPRRLKMKNICCMEGGIPIRPTPVS